MFRRVVKVLAVTVAIILLIAAGVTPFVPGIASLVATGSELHHMADTGLPASVELLEWTDWQEGADTLHPTRWAPQPGRLADAKIVAYRIGEAKDILTKFTFYQARYILADGTEVIAPAEGPEPLVSARLSFVVVIVLLLLAASVVLFICGVRL